MSRVCLGCHDFRIVRREHSLGCGFDSTACFELEDQVLVHPCPLCSPTLAVFRLLSVRSSGQRPERLFAPRRPLPLLGFLPSRISWSDPQRPHLFGAPNLLQPPLRSHKARHHPRSPIPSPTCANLPQRHFPADRSSRHFTPHVAPPPPERRIATALQRSASKPQLRTRAPVHTHLAPHSSDHVR
jgi:hypothetical protein